MSTAIHDTLPADSPATAAPIAPAPKDPLGAAGASETRTFRGRTVDELIPKIQAELGRDAIVIRRQSGLTGGFAGFFQRPYVEIEARRGSPGIDRYDEDDAAPALPGDFVSELDLEASRQAAGSLEDDLDAAPARPSALDEEFRELTAAGLGAEPRTVTPSAKLGSESLPAPFAAALAAAEAAASPQTFDNSQPAAARPSPELSARAQSPRRPQPEDAQAASAPHPSVSRSRARDAIERKLLEVGVGEQSVRELLEAASGHVMPFMPARTSLARAVQEALRQRIPTPRALPAGNATIAVVGPGGSGKTSFCAALLDAYGKRSALEATCAAVIEGEQRGALGLVLAPHTEPTPVGDPQARTALHAAREQGLVVLDTPAVSAADAAAVRALAALLAELQADRVVLALPATLGASSVTQLLEALRPLNADTIAVTHVNETDQLGVAVDAACVWNLAPAYTLDSGRGGKLAQLQPADLAERLLGGR